MLSVTPRLQAAPFEAQPIIPEAKPRGGFWWTLGWYAVARLAYMACFAPFFLIEMTSSDLLGGPTAAALLKSIGEVASVAVTILVFIIAARRAGWSVRGDLGLVWPQWQHIPIGLGLMTVPLLVYFGLEFMSPRDEWDSEFIKEFIAARDNPTTFVLLWISTVIITPILEETAYRGFVLRGWIASPLDVAGAILLRSMFFAVLHLQFNASTLISLLVGGCLLGVMRCFSGSIVPCVLMHAAWNAMALLMLTSMLEPG
jgi:membrane protease YdiL (CAAX protease family)